MIIEPIQSNFSAGEISPRLRAQSNTDLVRQSVKRMENMIPENHGIAQGRWGSREVASVAFGTTVGRSMERVIPFQASNGEWFIVEFSAEENGGANIEIRVYKRSAITTTQATFEYYDFPSTSYVSRNYAATNYEPGEPQDIHYLQIKDQLIMVHGSHPPMRLIRYYKSNGDERWAFGFLGTFGAPWGNGVAKVVPGYGAPPNLANDIGYPRTIGFYQQRIVYGGFIDQPSRLVFSRTDDFTSIDSGYFNTQEYLTARSGYFFNDTSNPPDDWPRVFELIGSYNDLTQIQVFVTDEYGTLGDRLEQGTDYEILQATDDTTQWTAFMNANHDSSLGATIAEDIGFVPTIKTRFDAKAPPRVWIEFNTEPPANIAFIGSRPEDSGLVFDLASNDQDTIQWIATGESLYIGTTGGEWVGEINQYISAINPPSFSKASSYGSQHIQPVYVGDAVLFVTASGREIRAFKSDFTANRQKWGSVEITWAAEHFFRDYRIKEIAHAKTPDNLIYVMTTDGSLYTAVYDPDLRESVGWAKVIKETNYLSITTVMDVDADKLVSIEQDEIFVNSASNPTAKGTTKAELYTLNITHVDADMDNARFEESPTPITTVNLNDFPAYLWGAYERYAITTDDEIDICVMSDGAVDYFGKISDIPRVGNVYTLNSPGRFVEIGIPFTQLIELSDMDYGVQGSDYRKRKKRTKIELDLIDSQPPRVNGDYPADRSTDTLMGNVEAPIDGKVEAVSKGYDLNAPLIISQEFPYRLQLAAVFGRINMGTE